ncbi:cardiolipin synthase [Aromatoleum toluclasticum]|uniref:cardiolipin synthase n=1 Tax=Aromatoleum toluclasticum TaxID=92003 RepID=UPI001E5ACB3D|nr:cardiolipin synthase [Aromatoleum toluclasticum]
MFDGTWNTAWNRPRLAFKECGAHSTPVRRMLRTATHAKPCSRVNMTLRQAPLTPRRLAWRKFRMAGLFGLFVLAGCGNLPTIVPDMSRRGPAPQLQGAHGPLSAEQSKAVLDRLASGGRETDIFERHLALEEAIAGSPLTTGNRVRLLQDGPATYSAMLAAIRDARNHINMETYILDDDEIGQRFAQALIDKQQQGVQVNLIRDSAGTIGTPADFFQRLTGSGVHVLEFNPLNPLVTRKEWELNQRDHRKLLIVDGHTAFLGGINISSVYSSGSGKQRTRPGPDGNVGWRDTHLQVQGPVVAELQKLFLSTWEAQKGAPLKERNYFPRLDNAGPHVVRAIGSSPDEPFSLIYATLLSAIGSAESSVLLTNAYFVPDPQLLAALKAAARRGVDVTLILPGQTDSWLVLHAGRGYYDQLLSAGVKIHERRGAILHSKTALIDGVWATIGSTNLDWRSFLHNHELNAVVLGAEFGRQVHAMFKKDLAESDAITLEQWRSRPLHLRLQELFARAWEYWL